MSYERAMHMQSQKNQSDAINGLINAKDEIINKLTERLDALELKFKALK